MTFANFAGGRGIDNPRARNIVNSSLCGALGWRGGRGSCQSSDDGHERTNYCWRSFFDCGRYLWGSPSRWPSNKHSLLEAAEGEIVGLEVNVAKKVTIDGGLEEGRRLRILPPGASCYSCSGRLFAYSESILRPENFVFVPSLRQTHFCQGRWTLQQDFEELLPLPDDLGTFYNRVLSTKGNIFEGCTLTWPPLRKVILRGLWTQILHSRDRPLQKFWKKRSLRRQRLW